MRELDSFTCLKTSFSFFVKNPCLILQTTIQNFKNINLLDWSLTGPTKFYVRDLTVSLNIRSNIYYFNISCLHPDLTDLYRFDSKIQLNPFCANVPTSEVHLVITHSVMAFGR